MAEIQKLLPRHFGLLNLVLAGAHTIKQMASMMNMTEAGVRNIINAPLFQGELARRRRAQEQTIDDATHHGITQAKDLLARNAYAAVEKIEHVMATAGDEKTQLSAADMILKYAFPKEDRSMVGKHSTTVVCLSPEKLQNLRSILAEVGYTSQNGNGSLSQPSAEAQQPPVDLIIHQDGSAVNV